MSSIKANLNTEGTMGWKERKMERRGGEGGGEEGHSPQHVPHTGSIWPNAPPFGQAPSYGQGSSPLHITNHTIACPWTRCFFIHCLYAAHRSHQGQVCTHARQHTQKDPVPCPPSPSTEKEQRHRGTPAPRSSWRLVCDLSCIYLLLVCDCCGVLDVTRCDSL